MDNFLIQALKKYQHFMGQGLLLINACSVQMKVEPDKADDIKKCPQFFFDRAHFKDLNTFLECTCNLNSF